MKIVVILCLALVALVSTVSAGCECDDHFSGFGTEPGKCGCCPWPCCCKCLEIEEDCKECPCMNLAFLIDESGSIGSADWSELLNFTQGVVDEVATHLNPDACDDQLFVSVITYGNNATLHCNNLPYETCDIGSIPQAMKHTNLVEAMEVALNEVFNTPSKCIPFAIIITDGRASFRVDEIPAMSADLRAAVDDNLYCIGITTNIDLVQLNETCPEEDHRLSVLDFYDLVDTAGAMIDDLSIFDCKKEKCFCCCPPEHFWGGYKGSYY